LYTTRQFAQRQPEVLVKLAAGRYRTQRWLHGATAEEVALCWATYSLGVSRPKAPCGLWSLEYCFQASGLCVRQ